LAIGTSPRRPSRGGKHAATRTRKTSADPGAKRKPQQGTAGGTKRPRAKRGFFRRYWWAFVAAPLVLILALAGTLLYAYAHIKIPAAPPPAQTTYVYDRSGHLLTTLHGALNRTEIPLSHV